MKVLTSYILQLFTKLNLRTTQKHTTSRPTACHTQTKISGRSGQSRSTSLLMWTPTSYTKSMWKWNGSLALSNTANQVFAIAGSTGKNLNQKFLQIGALSLKSFQKFILKILSRTFLLTQSFRFCFVFSLDSHFCYLITGLDLFPLGLKLCSLCHFGFCSMKFWFHCSEVALRCRFVIRKKSERSFRCALDALWREQVCQRLNAIQLFYCRQQLASSLSGCPSGRLVSRTSRISWSSICPVPSFFHSFSGDRSICRLLAVLDGIVPRPSGKPASVQAVFFPASSSLIVILSISFTL